ncbi:hypothetical protein ONE63_008848 [Megalurothrips usitatus]|uniref:DNA repair and recombination protein RAD54-like n=1 Tax=Megalurothrips usitatus TaxID=439358 RepID=A0AAV7XQ86_9NEOP|nr:hypothetical protein ONE63_008848 [Megalurothrips usitatus]
MADDLEKPALSCRPCSEKLPMVLSSPSAQPVIQVPASIAQYLRNYQREGVRFLYQRYREGEGAILGDDMGLGKTVQAIAFISAILQMKGTKDDKFRHLPQAVRNEIAPGIEVPSVSPVLVICPASLSDNWADELQTWGHFNFFKISSSNKFEVINKAKRKECDVLITTFEFARSSIDLLNTVEWACVLADEVHRIKDPTSQISKALNSLHCNSRFGFTGTPYQNNMEEMWCLFNWSNPRAIRKLSNGTDEISRRVEHGMKSSATKREASDSKMAREKFSLISAKCLKRRYKELLAKHLPAKTDQIVFCELTDVQKNIYRMISQSRDVQVLLDSLKDKNMKGSLNKSMNKKTGLLFTYLHLLQKTANYVGLLVSGLSPQSNETTRRMCLRALEDYAGVEGIPQKRWLEALSDVQMSGKMLVLSEMIPAFMKNGDKILLFSYSTKVLDFVQNHLRKMKYKHWRLDGTTPAGKRFALVKSFNTVPEPGVFLLSTKAAGVGLNMTGANVVIIFDPNWNPAHDLQAQDRAYRLGQDRDVRVYRLLSTSTIEEFVYLRQVYKQQLGSTILTDRGVRRYFDSVPGDRRYYGELFGIRNLFSFRETSRSLTEELLEKQRQLEQALRLKVEAPSRQGISQAQIYDATIIDEKKIRALEGQKSGLNQLCEDIFESPCDDPIDEGTDNDGNGDEEEDDDDDDKNMEELNTSESGIPCGDTISTLLERTGAVRHVIEHQEVIAPSTMESFVTNCAVRDVFQKGINSQVPAFQCSLGSENFSKNRYFYFVIEFI